MMKIRNNNARQDVKNINLDMLVPQDHIIRKIDSALDLSFIYEKLSLYIVILELIVLILLFYLK